MLSKGDERLIRKRLIEHYLKTGLPATLDEFSKTINGDPKEIEHELNATCALTDLGGLNVAQAKEVIDFYDSIEFFENSIVETIEKYLRTRTRIERLEGLATGSED